MAKMRFFKSLLDEWLVIEEGVRIRPAIYYGSNLINLYQMYMTGQGEGFSIENPHPSFGWVSGKIEIDGEKRILVRDGIADRPVFEDTPPAGVVSSNFHPLPYTRKVIGFWSLQDKIVCCTGLKYYPNDSSTLRVYFGIQGRMLQMKILEYNSPKIVVIEGCLDLHRKTFGGYCMSNLDARRYFVTESEETLSIKSL